MLNNLNFFNWVIKSLWRLLYKLKQITGKIIDIVYFSNKNQFLTTNIQTNFLLH